MQEAERPRELIWRPRVLGLPRSAGGEHGGHRLRDLCHLDHCCPPAGHQHRHAGEAQDSRPLRWLEAGFGMGLVGKNHTTTTTGITGITAKE